MSEETTHDLPGGDLGRILTLLSSIGERLTGLEDKVERRLQETRPIWGQVLARLEAIEGRLGNIENRLGNVESRLGNIETKVESLETEMQSGFRKLELQMGELAKDVIVVRGDQRGLEKRMDKLEAESAQQ
ncbi:MAG: hypothetical protein LC802_10830 [Acidobacteria bacterium]|nr:hypothetical protein [Acidobacteriota bacterium]